MSTTTSTKRLPDSVAMILALISVVLGFSISEYLGTGFIVAVAATAVLMMVLAFAYNFVSS